MKENNIENINNINLENLPKPNNFKEYMMFCGVQILKYIFTIHFWGTVFTICLMGLGYLQFTEKINILSVLLFFKDSITGFHGIILGLLLIILLFVIYMINKIISLIHTFELTNKIDETLSKEYSSIRDELNNFIKILISLQSFCIEISSLMDQILKGLNSDNVNIKNIYHELISIAEVMHNIPSREMVMKMLTLRTRMIYVDAADKIIKYIADHSTIRRIMTLDENSKGVIIRSNTRMRSKNSYIDQRLVHDFSELKTLYIEDVYSYSKNTLDISIKEDIQKELDETLDSIIDVLLSPDPDTPLELEAFFYNIHYTVKNLGDKLLNMYSNNLVLPKIFNNFENNNDIEGCDEKK